MDNIVKIMQLLRTYDDVQKEYQKMLRAGGWPITGPQVGVLRIVAMNKGLSISQLAELMGIHVTTAEGYANRLFEKRMISIQIDPLDKRRKLLRLTKTGETIVAEVPLGYKSLLVSNLMKVKDDDRMEIRKGLEKLIEYMKKEEQYHAK